MKKLLLVILVMVSSYTYSQDYLLMSVGIDPKLAIDGAYEYDSSSVMDVQLKFGTRLGNGLEVGLQFEYADLKPYYFSYGLFMNYVLSNRKKTILYSLGVEGIAIDRGYNKRMQELAMDNVLAYGLNAEVRFRIVDDLFVGFILNETHRNDLKYMYGENKYFHTSGFIRFIYEIEQR